MRGGPVAGAVTVVTAAVVISIVTRGGTAPAPRRPPAPAGRVTVTAAPWSPHPTPSLTPRGPARVAPVSTPTPGGSSASAAAFVRAWANRRATPTAWAAALTPLTSPHLHHQLDGVDPTVVPADTVTGPPRRVTDTPTYTVPVTGPGGPGAVTVTLLWSGTRWVVDEVTWDAA